MVTPGPSIRVGDLEVLGLTDGRLKTPLSLLSGIEQSTAERLAENVEEDAVFIPVNNFLIRREGNTILIDAGAGNTMQPTTGQLVGNLRKAGVDPQTITHIFLTHMHPDHFNGLVDDLGRPHYPNAEILAHWTELDFWTTPAKAPEPEAVTKNRVRAKINLAPYRDRLRGLRDGEDVLGLSPVFAPGHTPGHTGWRIGHGADAFIAWGDIVHISDIQIACPDAAIAFDLDKDLAIKSRKRLLDIAASDRIAVAGAHIKGSGFGYVVRSGSGYSFEPVHRSPSTVDDPEHTFGHI